MVSSHSVRRPTEAALCFLLRLSLLLLLLIVLSSDALVASAAATTAASPDDSGSSATLPPRTLVPTYPALHILFVVGLASYTHVAAPIEYMLELKRRGHRISWQQPRHLVSWFGSDEERLSLPFNFSLVDVDYSGIDVIVRLMTEGAWMEALDEVSRHFEPTYPPMYRALLEAVERDRPDLIVCDSFADYCVDVATVMQLPSVLTHCTSPMDGYALPHFDTPSMLTTFSHRWHEQPLWHRLYNTYGLLPQLAWYGLGSLRRIQAMKKAVGAPVSAKGVADWTGREVLYDSSWAWEWPLYWPPYVHMVGPIPKTWRRQSEQLDTALQSWLDDSAAAGIPVVYVAMGTSATLTEHWMRTFTTAFTSCPALPVGLIANNQTRPFRVLWATRNSPRWLTEALPASVRVERWVNQPAVLAHSAVRLFISHSGMASVQEAVAVGLPILALPLMFDQPAVAPKLRDRGVAEILDKLSSTADDVCAGMRRLVFDPQVQLAAGRLQRLYHRPDGGGLQRAVDIIERAAVSQEHLIPYRERTDVSWLVRYNVDVYAVGVAVLMAVLAVCGVLVRLVVRAVWRGVAARADKSKVA